MVMLKALYMSSLSSAGSQFRNPGLFEVTKAARAEEKTEHSTEDNRALEVAVGSDLEGTAEIRVAIVQSGKELEIATVKGKNLSLFQNSRYSHPASCTCSKTPFCNRMC